VGEKRARAHAHRHGALDCLFPDREGSPARCSPCTSSPSFRPWLLARFYRFFFFGA
jgi:hypothetical protein